MRRRRLQIATVLASVAVAVGTVALAVTPAASQVAASCSVSSADQATDTEEQALLGLINQYRQANGKAVLATHSGVTRAAAWFSRDMASKNYFPPNHVDSSGRTVGQRLTWCGVSYTNYAENIYAGRPDASSVFNAWKASSGHNANMLRDGVTAAGIARAYHAGSTYGWYWTLDLTNSAAVSPTTTVALAPATTAAPATTTTTAPRPTSTTTVAPPTTTAPTTATTAPPRSSYDALVEWYRAGR